MDLEVRPEVLVLEVVKDLIGEREVGGGGFERFGEGRERYLVWRGGCVRHALVRLVVGGPKCYSLQVLLLFSGKSELSHARRTRQNESELEYSSRLFQSRGAMEFSSSSN